MKKKKTQPYARMHYCGHSPDPADYWWGVICPNGTLDFDTKKEAAIVCAFLNMAYEDGLNKGKS